MPTAERFKTLHEWLGVAADAGDREVQEAWHQHEIDAAFQLDRIPAVVTLAYKILHDSNGRAWYREVLDACHNGHPIVVPADKRNAFETVCRLTKVRSWPDDKLPDAFHVRLPGQKEPDFIRRRSEQIPQQRKSETRGWLVHLFRQVVLFQCFRKTTMPEKFGLIILYGGVIYVSAVGLKLAYTSLEESAERSLKKNVIAEHPRAVERVRSLEKAAGEFRKEFLAVTGLPLDKAARDPEKRSRELDLVLLRNESVREAWAEIERIELRPEELAEVNNRLNEIGERIEKGRFLADDRTRLAEVNSWVERKSKLISLQRQFLDHIRVMLEAERAEQAAADNERSTP